VRTLADLPVPHTSAAHAALEVATAYCSPALLQHSQRSYLWAAARGLDLGLDVDYELLYVASLLHDVGLVRQFDNVSLSFDEAGAHVAWVFAAGAGWSLARRTRAAEVIIRHMWDEVDPAEDAEGHLLEVGTAIDISGRDPDLWSPQLRAEILAAHPRLDLAPEFTACFADQARRKPDSSAAAAVRGGIAERIARNPLDAGAGS
jgi:hypothetical protein